MIRTPAVATIFATFLFATPTLAVERAVESETAAPAQPDPPGTLSVPGSMAFQGYLTDTETGQPLDTTVTIDVALYHDDVGGPAVWSERHDDVPVNDGVFAIPLGQFTALPLSIFTGQTLFLGVAVDGGAELPRTRLRSAPFAMRAAIADSAVAVGAADDGDWVPSGNDLFAGVPGNVGIGTATPIEKLDVVGELRVESREFDAIRVHEPGQADYVALGYYDGGPGDEGGSLMLRDENGAQMTYQGPGLGGDAVLYLTGPGFNGIVHDTNWDGLGNPVFYLTGNGSGHQFDASVTGDDATFLPDASVSANETLNESGISNGYVNGSVNVSTGSTMADVVTTTIDIPTAGYVVVEAQAQAGLSGTTSGNWIDYQIDELAGGFVQTPHYQRVGMAAPPNTGLFYWPVSSRRVYYKTTAGSYTFRLEAVGTSNGSKYLFDPKITATFCPTSYGAVQTVTSPNDVHEFREARRAATQDQGPRSVGREEGWEVDLRELELEAARAHAAAVEAKLRLLRARSDGLRARTASVIR